MLKVKYLKIRTVCVFHVRTLNQLEPNQFGIVLKSSMNLVIEYNI